MNIKMPTREQLRLQMGELSPQEVRIAQAAYRLGPAEAIRAAVGGEAQPVAWQVWRNGKVSASLTRPPMVGEVAYDEGETVRALYASPPATVDVGAGKEALAIIDKWMESYDHMGTGTSADARMSEREWEEDRAKLAALIGGKA